MRIFSLTIFSSLQTSHDYLTSKDLRRTWRYPFGHLFDNVGDGAGADGAATLADSEAHALLHGDRRDQLDLEVDVVARHHHLRARRQVRHPGDVRRPEVELRPVA